MQYQDKFTIFHVLDSFFRGSDYYEQHFIVSTGIDCRLPATIYVRVTDRQILTWIQKVTGNYPRPLELIQKDEKIKT